MSRRSNLAVLTVCTALSLGPLAANATQYEYDALDRVTRVTYDNGDSIAYSYDVAGNITSVTSKGRCSVSVEGRIKKHDHDAGQFTFKGTRGEPVTLRLEAIPPEEGVGKFAGLSLYEKSVSSALPTELTAVLPHKGKFMVHVDKPDDHGRDRYTGRYLLTLEASPGACDSFAAKRSDGHK
jgi:YD repeat-containing protein